MARARPRSNVYALMPILACLIMGLGIYFTWTRVSLYTEDLKPAPRVKVVPTHYVEPNVPMPGAKPATATPATKEGETPVVAPGEGETKGAPTEGDKEAPSE